MSFFAMQAMNEWILYFYIFILVGYITNYRVLENMINGA